MQKPPFGPRWVAGQKTKSYGEELAAREGQGRAGEARGGKGKPATGAGQGRNQLTLQLFVTGGGLIFWGLWAAPFLGSWMVRMFKKEIDFANEKSSGHFQFRREAPYVIRSTFL